EAGLRRRAAAGAPEGLLLGGERLRGLGRMPPPSRGLPRGAAGGAPRMPLPLFAPLSVPPVAAGVAVADPPAVVPEPAIEVAEEEGCHQEAEERHGLTSLE